MWQTIIHTPQSAKRSGLRISMETTLSIQSRLMLRDEWWGFLPYISEVRNKLVMQFSLSKLTATGMAGPSMKKPVVVAKTVDRSLKERSFSRICSLWCPSTTSIPPVKNSACCSIRNWLIEPSRTILTGGVKNPFIGTWRHCSISEVISEK